MLGKAVGCLGSVGGAVLGSSWGLGMVSANHAWGSWDVQVTNGTPNWGLGHLSTTRAGGGEPVQLGVCSMLPRSMLGKNVQSKSWVVSNGRLGNESSMCWVAERLHCPVSCPVPGNAQKACLQPGKGRLGLTKPSIRACGGSWVGSLS